MSETTLQRPRQVTTASIIGGVGSLLLVVSLFDLMSGLRSIEAREQIAEKLASPAYEGLGLDAGFVTDALRTLLLVNGALAAAAVVLAVYVFQRHRGARLGFGIAAALLFVGTFVLADWIPGVPFGLTVVLAFAASLLWSPPVRDWYAGRAPAPPPEQPARSSHPASTSAAWAPPSVQSQPPDRAPHPEEPHPPADRQQPAPASYPYGQQRPADAPRMWAPPPATARSVDPHRRPGQVTTAVALTWIVASLVAFTFGLVVLMLMVARDTLLEAIRQAPELESSGFTTDELMAALWATSAILLFWCLAACVLAFLAFRRQGWARGALVGSAAMATLVSLLAFPLGLLVAVPAAVSAGLLLSAPARAWYAAPPGPPTGPAGGPPPSAGGGAPPYPQQQPPPQQPPPPPPQGKPPVW
jgi:hypothetical protein